MRPSNASYIITVGLAAVVAFGVARMSMSPLKPISAVKTEAVYDRVLRMGTIRCGYVVYPPYLLKDPNSGQMSGPAYDVMQAIAKELSLRLDWVEETGWGTFQEGLNGNRYDLMCVPVWQSGGRARAALLSEPVYYNAMYAFAREEDHRFDHNVESINKPDVRIIIEDNNPVQATRQLRFPLAQELSLPEVSNPADAPMSVATNKADIYFDNIVNFTKFNAVSPHKLKIVANGQPLRVFANVFAVKLGEFSFKAALDSTIESLRNSGELSVIISKYTPYMLDSQPTYAEPKNQPTS